jgi:hypothetical protein
MISLARATHANIRQNIAIALGLKGIFLVTTLLGLTGLWLAVLADTGATVLVARQRNHLRQAGEAVMGQRRVGGLQRYIGAAAHRNTDGPHRG